MWMWYNAWLWLVGWLFRLCDGVTLLLLSCWLNKNPFSIWLIVSLTQCTNNIMYKIILHRLPLEIGYKASKHKAWLHFVHKSLCLLYFINIEKRFETQFFHTYFFNFVCMVLWNDSFFFIFIFLSLFRYIVLYVVCYMPLMVWRRVYN